MAINDSIRTAETIASSVKDINNNISKMSAVIQTNTGKNSLTRLTRDQIFQFPIVMSADIDNDEKYPIIKNIEKNYASLVMTAITNEGVINRDQYKSVNDFLKKFHNNADIPFPTTESADEIIVTEAIVREGYIPVKELEKMDMTLESQLDLESINSIYLPFNKTKATIQRAIEKSKIATEADSDLYIRRPVYKKDKYGKFILDNNRYVVDVDKYGNPKYEYIQASKNDIKNGIAKPLSYWDELPLNRELEKEDRFNRRDDAKEERRYQRELEKEDRFNRRDDAKEERRELIKARSNIRGEFAKAEKNDSLMPTMLNITLANSQKEVGSWSQQLVIGVRAVPRYLPPSLIISNMCEAFRDRTIFSFLKFTKGELKWWDVLFGISSAKNNAITNSTSRWLKVLKSRAKKRRSKKYNPNMTIIITENEAIMIKEKCGIDPHNTSSVRKMMDKYFLLAFGIYDTEAKMLNIIYDGDNEFSQMSLRTLVAESKKETNLLAMNRY